MLTIEGHIVVYAASALDDIALAAIFVMCYMCLSFMMVIVGYHV